MHLIREGNFTSLRIDAELVLGVNEYQSSLRRLLLPKCKHAQRKLLRLFRLLRRQQTATHRIIHGNGLVFLTLSRWRDDRAHGNRVVLTQARRKAVTAVDEWIRGCAVAVKVPLVVRPHGRLGASRHVRAHDHLDGQHLAPPHNGHVRVHSDRAVFAAHGGVGYAVPVECLGEPPAGAQIQAPSLEWHVS